MSPTSPSHAVSGTASPLVAIRNAIAEIIRGKPETIELAIVTLVAAGHLLIEDIPGVGKSTLARSLAHAVGGDFRRVQFTSDLLPADLLGVNVWLAREQRFEFRPGPIFGNVVLADEINRAPPRTQSALLEAMGERQVSVDGASRPLPVPFMVIATQNPEEHHGTYPLPESQRDRFLLRLSMGHVDPATETELLRDPTVTDNRVLDPVSSPGEIAVLQQRARQVFVHEDLARYAQRVIQSSREHASVRIGASTRAALGWVAAARSRALLDGRSHVSIDDLQDLAVPALAHRLVPIRSATGIEHGIAEEIIRDIVATVPVPT